MSQNPETLWHKAQTLYRHGWLDASREALEDAFSLSTDDPMMAAQLADFLGRIAVRRNRFTTGSNWFRRALQALDADASNPLTFAIQVRLNMAMAAEGHVDRAIRGMQHLESYAVIQSPRQQAIFQMNFAVMYMHNEFYPQSLVRLQKAQVLSSSNESEDFGYALYTNLGVVLLELSDWNTARDSLTQALRLTRGKGIHALNELTHLAQLTGDEEAAYQYGTRAMSVMWGSLMTFEKGELALLCEVLARLAGHWGASALRSQLIDTSQALYGQLGMWRQWRRLQEDLAPVRDIRSSPPAPFFEEVLRFAQLLQAMLAQDILHPNLAAIADVRTQIAQALAQQRGWTAKEREALNLVCRLADYGLTAIDYDILHDPKKTAAAWQRYQKHPELSIRLLESLSLPSEVTSAIRDHHEQPDGLGFPAGKPLEEIAPMALVFQVAHSYAWNVIQEGVKHSDALIQAKCQAGSILDPQWAAGLEELFETMDEPLSESP